MTTAVGFPRPLQLEKLGLDSPTPLALPAHGRGSVSGSRWATNERERDTHTSTLSPPGCLGTLGVACPTRAIHLVPCPKSRKSLRCESGSDDQKHGHASLLLVQFLRLPLPVQSSCNNAGYGKGLRTKEEEEEEEEKKGTVIKCCRLARWVTDVGQSGTQGPPSLSLCIDSFGCYSVTVGSVAVAACVKPPSRSGHRVTC